MIGHTDEFCAFNQMSQILRFARTLFTNFKIWDKQIVNNILQKTEVKKCIKII